MSMESAEEKWWKKKETDNQDMQETGKSLIKVRKFKRTYKRGSKHNLF